MKTKKFRVAVEGATIDGRTISREWLQQCANNYDPNVYGARVWIEHFRGILPDSNFKAYGDVLAVTVEEVDVGGEKKLALFAEIDATNDLIEINKNRQKIYTSVEIDTNFQGKGTAYLVGLAITDSPASIGTEKLKFNSMAVKFGENAEKNQFSEVLESQIELEGTEKAGMLDHVIERFRKVFQTEKTEENTKFNDIKNCLEQVATAFEQQQEYFNATITAQDAKIDALKAELEKLHITPEPNPKRPEQTGTNSTETVIY